MVNDWLLAIGILLDFDLFFFLAAFVFMVFIKIYCSGGERDGKQMEQHSYGQIFYTHTHT